MIQIELKAKVEGLTEGQVEALGDALDLFGTALTYDIQAGELFARATVERMTMFLAFDRAVLDCLADMDRFADRMAYAVVSPA